MNWFGNWVSYETQTILYADKNKITLSLKKGKKINQHMYTLIKFMYWGTFLNKFIFFIFVTYSHIPISYVLIFVMLSITRN